MEIAGRALPEGSWWDWEVIGWDAGRFRLAAGHDLTFHHGLEVHFLSPALVSCPFAFQDPVFRPPTAAGAAGAGAAGAGARRGPTGDRGLRGGRRRQRTGLLPHRRRGRRDTAGTGPAGGGGSS
ncbi:hypothetical protein [Streptomyces bauhiniae]|uniref:hypothetical protein n=1 Tax=Streptomyces bauhiniae TaxID=2340725 RepID=UPI003809CEBF